ncbi:MAG: hypothetical protein J6S14_15890 [Clostridia bacterium]|nr:hypothetical protein [Clostridia bacterium]
MAEIRETCYEQDADSKCGVITTNELGWIRKIQRLAEEYPEDVVIKLQPDENYGYLLASVPTPWFVIRPPKKMNLSEEQKDALRERMAEARKKRNDKEN